MTQPMQAAIPRAPRQPAVDFAGLRAKAISWALEIAANPDVVFLDTETTGVDHTSEICDIGVVSIDGTVLVDQLVKPSIPIPDEASRIHGITNEMVADAPTWAEVSDLVAAAVDGRAVVIYNASYDTGILRNAGRLIHRQIEMHHYCAMLAFSDWKGELGRFGTSMKWHRLDVAAAEFGIPPGGHRALQDAETARRVVLAMAASDQERSEVDDRDD